MTAPHPSAEAVEAFARASHEQYELSNDKPIPWEDVLPIRQHLIRETLLPILTAAYPQIVADVLNYYADEAESPAQYGWVGRFSTAAWLRDLAGKVQS